MLEVALWFSVCYGLSIFLFGLYFKLFVLEFAFTFACLAFGRQALTLLNR
ncbi:MAG: hypothetical protein LBP59_18875 [Planctomycetaceae bacterium]|nr:hypothetical protein [Planctomycetaceae bacterium]